MFRDYWTNVEELHRAYNMVVYRLTKVWYAPGQPHDLCACVYNVTLCGGKMTIHQEVHNFVIVESGGGYLPLEINPYN